MDVTLKGTLTVTDSGQTVSIAPTSSIQVDLLAPELLLADRQAASTTLADIDFGSVGWDDATWFELKNDSEVDGEDIIILIPPTIVAGGTDDGTATGAGLAATLTSAGYYKTISADGTSQGKNWEKGDIAVYLGSSGVYLQLRPKRLVLKIGETAGPVRIDPDSDAWQFYSLTGTPQLQKVVCGPLDE